FQHAGDAYLHAHPDVIGFAVPGAVRRVPVLDVVVNGAVVQAEAHAVPEVLDAHVEAVGVEGRRTRDDRAAVERAGGVDAGAALPVVTRLLEPGLRSRVAHAQAAGQHLAERVDRLGRGPVHEVAAPVAAALVLGGRADRVEMAVRLRTAVGVRVALVG